MTALDIAFGRTVAEIMRAMCNVGAEIQAHQGEVSPVLYEIGCGLSSAGDDLKDLLLAMEAEQVPS